MNRRSLFFICDNRIIQKALSDACGNKRSAELVLYCLPDISVDLNYNSTYFIKSMLSELMVKYLEKNGKL